MTQDNALLLIALDAAVPLWIEKLREVPVASRIERARGLADIIASKGDVLQFGGKGCAEAFNALAESLACLAFQPGGVRFMGRHWEATGGKSGD